MKLVFIGLGRMGYGMVSRLIKNGHDVFVYDVSLDAVAKAEHIGAKGAFSLEDAVKNLKGQKIIWLMIPNQFVESVIEKLKPILPKESILIDGGNSHFEISKKRGEELEKLGIKFLDIGTSGGLQGAKIGYSIMVGGNRKAYNFVEPIIKSLSTPNGYNYFGPYGAGHFVKMVHNAIEYGFIGAMAEGFDLLKRGPYKNLDMLNIARVWNNNSIIRSFLMEMMEKAFVKDKNLENIPSEIGDSGEGRWSVEIALKYNVPFTINTYALFSRYISRDKKKWSNKIQAALRTEFGGHTNKERA